jgi:ATP-dependent DNA helicase RecQ
VVKSAERKPQREMSNSAQQCANVQGGFGLSGPMPKGAVLLIDDLVDSGWTVTVVAALLREHGVGEVQPAILGQSRSD